VKTVVGMFETTSDVDATITELTSNGFDKSDISVVARREVGPEREPRHAGPDGQCDDDEGRVKHEALSTASDGRRP